MLLLYGFTVLYVLLLTLEYTTVYKLKPYSKMIFTFYASSFATLPDCITWLWGVTSCSMQVRVSVLWEV